MQTIFIKKKVPTNKLENIVADIGEKLLNLFLSKKNNITLPVHISYVNDTYEKLYLPN